jgi:hypothetical protein
MGFLHISFLHLSFERTNLPVASELKSYIIKVLYPTSSIKKSIPWTVSLIIHIHTIMIHAHLFEMVPAFISKFVSFHFFIFLIIDLFLSLMQITQI